MQTIHGYISFEGKIKDGRIMIDIEVPEGTLAHMIMNGVDENMSSGKHHFETPAEIIHRYQ